MFPKVNPVVPTNRASRRQVSRSLNVTQKLVLTLSVVVLATISIWMASVRVHSAPGTAANPPPAPVPEVKLVDVPAEALIGEKFKFKVTFDNIGTAVGYGPFIDVVLPAGGMDLDSLNPSTTIPGPCDGISTNLNGSLVSVNGGPIPVTTYNTLTTPCSSNGSPITHPYSGSGVSPISVPPGGQLITLELPFGSFEPNQPKIEVELTVDLHKFADTGAPNKLTIYASGGFRFGMTPLNEATDPPILTDAGPSNTWLEKKDVIPTVFTLKKAANAPEDETATGPNFLREYTIIADIANGQQLDNLKVQDFLHNNVQYQGGVVVKIGTTTATGGTCPGVDYELTQQPPTSAAQNSPNSDLEVSFCHPISGTSAAADVTITFAFFIPEQDANNTMVLPTNCKTATSINDVKAEADWTPADPRDVPMVHISSDLTTQDHVLKDKCLAIQKSVAIVNDTGTPGLTPNDTLLYTLKFQISDYKTIGNLVVEDFISNGQTLVLPVMLTVSDQFGTKSGPIPSPFITQTADPQGAAHFCPAVPQLQQPQNGTVLTFNVSSAMPVIPAFTAPRLAAGILTGGYAAGNSAPNNPAVGTITFRAKVGDVFQLPVAPGDKFVDKDDPVNNCVRISGKVYQNVGRPNPINFPTNIPNVVVAGANDDSNTATLLLGDTLKKTVYSVKRANAFGIYNPICGPPSGPGGTSCSNSPNPPQEVRAGDQVTYRIEKVIPSSDAENLVVEDWLPQPAYTVAGINFTNATCVGVPNPGNSCLGPTDTLHSLPLAPTVLAFPGTNSVTFNYGSFNDTSNLSRKIDLLFTYKVTSQPFADGLFLTNEAQECETNTFGAQFCQVAIAQVNLREPNLRIRKGIVATDNPNGTFTHPGLQTANLSTAQAPPGATFTLGGISGVVNSNDLAAGLVNDDVSSVDANDIVTFAVTIENLGGAPAYDVKIQDIIPTDTSGNPSCFTLLPNPIVVKRGTGVVVPPALYSISPTTILPTTTSFTITSNPIPIPLSAYNATSGANIVVITFQAKLLANIKPGCCDNVVELTQYASVLGGPNFVGANFTPPFTDSAQVCVKPKAEKCVTATSEAHTQADNSVSGTPQPPQVAIGEIIRYHLTITLPEGVSPFFKVTDHLPLGLTYMPGTAKVAFVSTLGIATSAAGLSAAQMPDPVNYTLGCLKPNPTALLPSSLVSPGSFTPGDDPSFGLGILTNNDNDNNLEYVVIEFNALVNNVPTNFDTVTLKNNYEIFLGKVVVGQIPVAIATSNDADVIVVEPKLTMTKTVAPNPALKGQTLTYTVQYTNNGTADAFNVELKDTLPPGLTFGTIAAGCPFTNVPANTLTVTCAQIPKAPNPGSTVVVSYQAIANPATCPVTLENRAALTWTSLPGPNGTTVNQTGSSTPGNSGSSDGERDGVTPPLTLNDYAAPASAGVKIDCPCEATISGLKFNDLNGNGVRDTGEPGISGWTIKITDSSGNTQTTTTDSSGNYSFTVPAPGTYTVAEVLQSGWAQTAPSTGNYSVTVSPGQIITNRNFGNRKKQGCDLQVTKEVKPSPLVSGQQATVTITVKNLGTGPCHGPTQVTESMPAGLTLVSASVPGGSCVLSTGVCNYAPGIPAGGSVVFTYVFNVATQPGTNFENCASLKNSEDQNPQNDGACVPLKVSGDKLPDLTIKKTVQCGGPAIPQGTCSVSFTISNNGPGAFNGIAVIKDLVTPTPSPGLGWAGSSTPPGWSCGIGGPGSVGCATTSSVSLVPGQSTSFSILLKVPAGQFQNCASVKGYTQFPYSASTLIQESDFNNNESCVSMGESASGDCVTPPPGMVAWWPGDHHPNDIRNGNHGTLVGGVGYAQGRVGQAFSFPNLSSTGSDRVGLNSGPSANTFTIDAWVFAKEHGPSSYRTIYSDNARGFFLQGGRLNWWSSNGGARFVGNSILQIGAWHHIALSYSSGTFTGYVNGVKDVGALSLSSPGEFLPTGPGLGIGGHSNFVPEDFDGLIDEVEIFNRALSVSEIESIFKAGSAGKCKTGSLTVTKTLKNSTPLPLPSGTTFPITVSCLPSGPGVTVNLPVGGMQTLNNIPIGSKCTVTEGGPPLVLVASPNCTQSWSPPTYSPSQSVTISNSGAPQTVTIENQLSCKPGLPKLSYGLTRGMNEFCLQGGSGYFNSAPLVERPFINEVRPIGNTGGVRFHSIGVCYGRILAANERFAFKYTFNATPVAVLSYPQITTQPDDFGFPVPVSETRRNVFGGGLSPIGFQLYFRPQKRIKPFVSTSAGFLFFKDPVLPLNGTRFNFVLDFGGGVQVFRDSRRAFSFGYKYQRLSGGSGALNNPGLDGHGFQFGYATFNIPRVQ